jgi:hypothetical protein
MERFMRASSDPPNPERPGKTSPAKAREHRLKAALKANMGRRKAQAKARSAGQTAPEKSASGENEKGG